MKKTTTVLCIALLLLSLQSSAQSTFIQRSDSSKNSSAKSDYRIKRHGAKLNPTEKEMYKESIKEKVASMSPEDKRAFKDQMRKKVEDMTPEEK